MSTIKTASFAEKDEELVNRIIEYQRAERLSSFIDAVRILCQDALDFKRMTKK